MSVLVVYFSAEGNTKKVARAAAKWTGADLYEIKPEVPYSAADINWRNPLSRCNREKIGRKDVPVSGQVENFADYDTVLIGFPIWYGSAPNVVNTFCKGYDWSGKKVGIFATSGGSGMGKTSQKLQPYVNGAEILGDCRIVRRSDLEDWLKSIGLAVDAG